MSQIGLVRSLLLLSWFGSRLEKRETGPVSGGKSNKFLEGGTSPKK